MKKYLMTMALAAGAMLGAWAANVQVVRYYDPTDPDNPDKEADCTLVTSSTTILTRGWYAVKADVTIMGRITVSGSGVHLILCDGATLNATNGVQVAGSNSLTVYGQAKGTGALFALSPAIYYAGIGGNDRESGGTLTVNGGRLTVRGGQYGAAIGGGRAANGGKLVVNGGQITAEGYNGSAGIGGGDDGSGGEVEINGGHVTAIGSIRVTTGQAAAGIGAGRPLNNSPKSGTVKITGGTVVAIAGTPSGTGKAAQAIGVNLANASADTGTLTLGDAMLAYASESATSPVAKNQRTTTCHSQWVMLVACRHDYEHGACRWCGAQMPVVTDVVVEQPALWDGMVDVSFTVTNDVAKGFPDWNRPFLSIMATDNETGSNYVAAVSALSARAPYQLDDALYGSKGEHAVTWDMYGQGIRFASSNVTFTVAYVTPFDVPGEYCIIDLSGGKDASSYPVSYVSNVPNVPAAFNTDDYKTTKLAMRLIEPESEGKPPFYCAIFETTQRQWELVTGDNPSQFKNAADSPMRPVEQVSWNMIRGNADTYDWPNTNAVYESSFLGVLRLKSGFDALDLPTAAQWEYACRAGTTTQYSYGDTANGDYMWFQENSTNQTQAVGTKRPNAWDLYDMHGNVWEWCLDRYSSSGSYRVERGGSWNVDADICASSIRYISNPSDEISYSGFRLVRTLSDNLEGERSAEAVAGAERAGTVCFGMSEPVAVSTMPERFAAGEYVKVRLEDLGYDVPTNGTPYTVKAYGLPAGLKLKYNAAVTKKVKKGKKTVTVVVKPAKSEWWIEGVPTAALDYATNPPYLAITVGGVTETLQLPVEVLAQEVTDLGTFSLGTAWNAQTPLYLPGVTNGWTVSGLPSGLKYTSKLVTKANKKGKKVVSVTTNALPYSVYGKTKAAGLFTITAKKKKGAYYETMKYRMLVTPKAPDAAVFGDDLTNITTMAYVPVEWDLTGENGRARSPSGPQSGTDGEQSNVDGGRLGEAALPSVAAVGGKVAKVAGLPTGLAFAAATTYKDKKKKQVKQLGQTIVGTPTKPGTYVVTFTKNVTTGTGKKKKTVAKTAQILWTVVANDAPLSLGFNTSGGVIEGGVVGLKYGDLLAFEATSNATVKASGLPKGIKLVRLEEGGSRPVATGSGTDATGRVPPVWWGFEGFTAKAGTYLVTVTATLNGKTVTQRILLVVEGLPAWAKGTFNGSVKCKMENGELGEDVLGLATITVSSVGKISGKFYEGGTNWALSAASYTDGRARSPSGPQSQASGSQISVDAGGSASRPYQEFICSNVVAKYTYKAKEKVKGKLKTVTKYVTRTFALTVDERRVTDNEPAQDETDETRGMVAMTEVGVADVSSATTINAWQNLWGSTYKAVGKKLFYTSKKKQYKTFTVDVYTNDVGAATFIQKGDDVDKTGLTCFINLSLKITTAGAVTATLTYDTGKKKKGKAVIYKPTCSTVVIPTAVPNADPFTGEVPLYFAPSSANNFPGFATPVPF